ncbi:MAG: Primosomal protein N' [Desulfotomaculum sp. 46_296]|nr:MAG: Primosomal protein N' [Desulfotomaculum sp. 46_296]HAU32154.1 primosomal protein N' [Desulfotomaculum sp.]
MHAEVLINLPARRLDRTFSYRVPIALEGQVTTGSLVQISFGRQKIEGYVTSLRNPDGPEPAGIKDLSAVIDRGPVFTHEQLNLALWMSSYYLCPTVSALQTIIWPRLARSSRQAPGLWPLSPPGLEVVFKRAPSQKTAWETALSQPGLTRLELAAAAKVSVSAIDALTAKGLLIAQKRAGKHLLNNFVESRPFDLTAQQKTAFDPIFDRLKKKEHEVFLLNGITGSGKTEVYCHSVAAALRMGRQALILVPEIALTPQMLNTFHSRFGEEVAILHSRLSDGERRDEWLRIKEGSANVVMGTRSALFAPVQNPGLIVIDEEHEPSYKQEESPRYHARTAALEIAKNKQAVVVLGSATPSVESFFSASFAGAYQLLTISERVEKRSLPKIQVVDMREEIKKGNQELFSQALLSSIKDRLGKNEQTILFLNRRGFSTFISCRECGQVMKCPHCDISLTYHINGRLVCHYCNYTVGAPRFCPSCRSSYISYSGTGTQKIELEIKRLFPDARVLRMDSDTTSRKGSHQKILDTFCQGNADIMIGTQMIAKGLDIPAVTLVGVVNADLTLYMPDFRAAERTFQLLTQVAGRAGRSDLGGEVMIQTHSPEHFAITSASEHDYQAFFEQEIKNREILNYPPFTSLCRFLFTGTVHMEVENAAKTLYNILSEIVNSEGLNNQVQVFNAVPAPVNRIKNRYRWHLISRALSVKQLQDISRACLNEFDHRYPSSKIRIIVDIEPQNMF